MFILVKIPYTSTETTTVSSWSWDVYRKLHIVPADYYVVLRKRFAGHEINRSMEAVNKPYSYILSSAVSQSVLQLATFLKTLETASVSYWKSYNAECIKTPW